MNILTQYGQDIIGLDSELVNKIAEADTFIHTNKPAAQGGTDLTVVSTGDKYNWDHASGGGAGILHGACSTAASTAAKEVAVSGTFTLTAGTAISVTFTNANTANNPTLNVNSTGAKDMYVNNTKITTSLSRYLLEGTVIFIYDGSRWNLIGNYYDSDVSVMQNNSTSNSDYRLLLSTTAMDGTETSYCNKSANFKANPSTGNMTIGGRLTDVNGVQSIRRISEADYQALSSAEKNNGTIYHRYDKVGMDSLDINVKQTPNTTSMDAHPILFSASDSSGEVVGGTYKNPDFYYRTDLNRLILNNEGSISVYHTSADQKYTDVHGDHIASYDINNTHSIIWIEANDITLVDVQDGGTTYHNAWGGIDNSLQTSIRTLKQSLTDLTNKKIIREKLTLSSNSSGFAATTFTTSGYQLLSASGKGFGCLPFDGGDGHWFIVFLNLQTFAKYPNLSNKEIWITYQVL